MKVEIKDGELVLTIPMMTPPALSKSGKTLLVASTRGTHKTDLLHDGRPLSVSFNAYVKNPEYAEWQRDSRLRPTGGTR